MSVQVLGKAVQDRGKVLMYGADTLNKAQGNKLAVAYMRMLRSTDASFYLARYDWSARIREALKVGEIAKSVQERRRDWYEHTMRREDHYVGRMTMEMEVQGRRKRGRPNRTCLDRVRGDMNDMGLSGGCVRPSYI